MLFAVSSPLLNAEMTPLAQRVYQTFTDSCVACHGGHKKAKGGFGHVLDLQRLAKDEAYVELGKPEDSELYRLLIDEDPDVKMPPDDERYPALSDEQIQDVYRWIQTGAEVFQKAPLSGEGSTATTQATRSGSDGTTESRDLVGAEIVEEKSDKGVIQVMFSKAHPALVHFPIAFLSLSFFTALFAFFAERQGSGTESSSRASSRATLYFAATRLLLLLGTISALGAVASGWLRADDSGWTKATLDHRNMGLVTLALSLLSFALSYLKTKPWRLCLCLCLFLVFCLVSWTGHSGGLLVYGEGYWSLGE